MCSGELLLPVHWGLHGQPLTNQSPERGPYPENVSNIYLSETITGLQPYTTYDYQFCGKPAPRHLTPARARTTRRLGATVNTFQYGSAVTVLLRRSLTARPGRPQPEVRLPRYQHD